MNVDESKLKREAILRELGLEPPPAGPFDAPPVESPTATSQEPATEPAEAQGPNRKSRRRLRKSKLAAAWLFDRVVRATLANHPKDAEPYRTEHAALFAVEKYARFMRDAGQLSKSEKDIVCGISHARRRHLEAQREAAVARAAELAAVAPEPPVDEVLASVAAELDCTPQDVLDYAVDSVRAPEAT